MSFIDDLMLKVRRAETPAARTIKDAYQWAMRWNLPRNRALDAAFSAAYHVHDTLEEFGEMARGKFVYEPMLRARCHSVGEGLSVSSLPYIRGKVKITIGDNCTFSHFSVRSGRFLDQPELIIGDRSGFSYGVSISVNRRVTIGSDVAIAGRCWIADSDGHPSDPERRRRGEDLRLEDIDELVIENNVWIGHGSHILKGVTIGEGAVVAAGSTVTSDVPAGALAMGVPARIVKRPW